MPSWNTGRAAFAAHIAASRRSLRFPVKWASALCAASVGFATLGAYVHSEPDFLPKFWELTSQRPQPPSTLSTKSLVYIFGNNSDDFHVVDVSSCVRSVFFSPSSICGLLDEDGRLSIVMGTDESKVEVHTLPFFGKNSSRSIARHAAWTSQGIVVANENNEFFLVTISESSDRPLFSVEALPGPGIKVSKIVSGTNHVAVLSASGEIFTMGDNSLGQCGLGNDFKLRSYIDTLPTADFRPSLTRINPAAFDAPVIDVACGAHHTLFTTATGAVYSCGSDAFLQLGQFELPSLPPPVVDSDKKTKLKHGNMQPMPRGYRTAPCRVPPLRFRDQSVRVVRVAAGAKHSLALGYFAALPERDSKPNTSSPAEMSKNDANAKQPHVSWPPPDDELRRLAGYPTQANAGTSLLAADKNNNTSSFALLQRVDPADPLSAPRPVVLGWGYGVDGQLGLYRPPHVAPPGRIAALSHVPPPRLTKEQIRSQLNLAENNDPQTKSVSEANFDAFTLALTCGNQHSAALLSDGRVMTWGFNGQGQCGLERKPNRERLQRSLEPAEPFHMSAFALAKGGVFIQDVVAGPEATALVVLQTGSGLERPQLGEPSSGPISTRTAEQ
jgi:alpha-tubulin suppressor-like RCC1 family protein